MVFAIDASIVAAFAFEETKAAVAERAETGARSRAALLFNRSI
jgi:hypothetical protein